MAGSTGVGPIADLGPDRPLHAAEPNRIYLPAAARDPLEWPDPHWSQAVAAVREAFVERYPIDDVFPGYDRPPSGSAALGNVAHACHDFPDLPDRFGRGAHRRACDVWVASALALHHANRARSPDEPDAATTAQRDWSLHYLDVALDGMTDFAFRGSSEGGHRDTRAAVWQNPLRAADIALVLAVLHRTQPLDPDRVRQANELLVGVARAWEHAWWSTRRSPATSWSLETASDRHGAIRSPDGTPVGHRVRQSFAWDPDHGNSQAEEMAWLGAGVRAAVIWAAATLGPDERERLEHAADQYLDLALSYRRRSRMWSGEARTLNAERSGGAYGQRPLWLENHQPDLPAIPYLGATWHYLGIGAMAGWAGPPDSAAWRTAVDSAEATLTGPKGASLVGMREDGGFDFTLEGFPAWTTTCAQQRGGTLYIALGERGTSGWVSEIGHPAGPSVLAAGVPLLRLSVERGDHASWRRWSERLRRVTAGLERKPPSLEATECRVAPYVSGNIAYHWSYLMALFEVAVLQADGFTMTPGRADGSPDHQRPEHGRTRDGARAGPESNVETPDRSLRRPPQHAPRLDRVGAREWGTTRDGPRDPAAVHASDRGAGADRPLGRGANRVERPGAPAVTV